MPVKAVEFIFMNIKKNKRNQILNIKYTFFFRKLLYPERNLQIQRRPEQNFNFTENLCFTWFRLEKTAFILEQNFVAYKRPFSTCGGIRASDYRTNNEFQAICDSTCDLNREDGFLKICFLLK